MAKRLERWVRAHVATAADVMARWRDQSDDLLGRYDNSTRVWAVQSELELVRLIGALYWLNPGHTLWFRGETRFFEKAMPRRYRANENAVCDAMRWISRNAHRNRALRDRGPLARAAILQHYGIPTSLLDVSSNHEIAAAFAFEREDGTPHLRVYALPRHSKSVSAFDHIDVVLVDLRSELPSYCLRPHAQQAAFLARTRAVDADIAMTTKVPENQASLDPLCVAHIRLDFAGRERFYSYRKKFLALYPPASRTCEGCPGMNDMCGDFLLHLLKCLKRRFPDGCPADFPDNFSEPKDPKGSGVCYAVVDHVADLLTR